MPLLSQDQTLVDLPAWIYSYFILFNKKRPEIVTRFLQLFSKNFKKNVFWL